MEVYLVLQNNLCISYLYITTPPAYLSTAFYNFLITFFIHAPFQPRNCGKMALAYLVAYNIDRNKQCCRFGGFSPTCLFSFLSILSYLCMPNSQFLDLYHTRTVFQVLHKLRNANISYNAQSFSSRRLLIYFGTPNKEQIHHLAHIFIQCHLS